MNNTIFTLIDKLTFGKHKGATIEEVIDDDPSYLEWAIDEIEWFELDEAATKSLKNSNCNSRKEFNDRYDLYDKEY